MKRILKIFATLSFLFIILTACSSSAKDQFIKKMDNFTHDSYNGGKFDLQIKDFSSSTNVDQQYNNLMINYLTNIKLSGTYEQNLKTKVTHTTVEISALNQSIPVDIYTKGTETALIKGDFLSEIANFSKSNGFGLSNDENEIAKYKGKYIDISDYLSKGTKKATNNIKSSDTLIKFLKTLDENDFEINKNILTHTFTKKEINGYAEFALKNGTKVEKESAKELKESLANINKLNLKVEINRKTDQIKTLLTTQTKQQGEITDLTLAFNIKPKKTKRVVTLPNKDLVVSSDIIKKQYESFFSQIENNKSNALSKEMSDIEFEIILEEMKKLKESDVYSKEQLDTMLEIYKDLLTSEQYEKLLELFDNSSVV